ncbi:MAG: FeoB-associated Cys-rich membrane protein [Bacillota bacterium]|nr:FeoB-associated Cys-rich membrane protein [Bacillota bacterium]
MADFIVTVIILIIVGAAVGYIVKAKKKGVKCIGCPDASACAYYNANASDSDCGCGCCSCHSEK